MFLSVASTLGVLVAVYWTMLFVTQRAALFPAPDPGRATRPRDAEQAWLATPAGKVEAWFLPATSTTSQTAPAPLLIFTHGNGEVIDFWADEFTEPRSWGVHVLLVEYPGYGRSEGRPSEASITATVTAAFDWAVRHRSVDSARIIAYGRSVGGGGAAALARERPVAALVLESSFTSVRRMALRFGAPGFLVRDPFDNLAVVRAFARPVLVVHGEHDEIIPVSHGRALAAAAPHATLALLPCGHNDCPPPWPALKRFLEANRLLAPGVR